MLRNRSWALLILKPRSRLDEISRLWSFLTLLRNPSTRARFFEAETRRPAHGRGIADILRPSIAILLQNCGGLNKFVDSLDEKMWRNWDFGVRPRVRAISLRENRKQWKTGNKSDSDSFWVGGRVRRELVVYHDKQYEPSLCSISQKRKSENLVLWGFFFSFFISNLDDIITFFSTKLYLI